MFFVVNVLDLWVVFRLFSVNFVFVFLVLLVSCKKFVKNFFEKIMFELFVLLVEDKFFVFLWVMIILFVFLLKKVEMFIFELLICVRRVFNEVELLNLNGVFFLFWIFFVVLFVLL